MNNKIILAYSGGLDTSVILKWLTLKGYDVVAFIADVGQEEDFEQAREKALQIGASEVIVEDLKQQFVEEYIFHALKAGAIYEGQYLLGTAIARPLIAKKLIEFAEKQNATTIAHGATGKGNDQIRFELAALSLNPAIKIIAPWRNASFLRKFQGRGDLLKFAEEQQIPVSSTPKKPYSMDANLMHISYEAGMLETPSCPAPDELFEWTCSPMQAPDTPTKLSIQFQQGIPVSVTNHSTNESVSGALPLYQYLNKLGAENGIGRIDIVENRFLGMKSRGCYESPGATILWKAHLDLESLTLDGQVLHLKEGLSVKIAELIYNGLWFSPEMQFLMSSVEHSQQNVTGEVSVQLYKGNVSILSRSSPHNLYSEDLVSMDEAGGYNQEDASGFINCLSLRLRQSSELRHLL